MSASERVTERAWPRRRGSEEAREAGRRRAHPPKELKRRIISPWRYYPEWYNRTWRLDVGPGGTSPTYPWEQGKQTSLRAHPAGATQRLLGRPTAPGTSKPSPQHLLNRLDQQMGPCLNTRRSRLHDPEIRVIRSPLW